MDDIEPDIRRLRDIALRRTDDLHDDHVRTGRLWQEVLVRDRYGLPPLVVVNAKTGSTTETAQQWVERARESNARLRVRTFKELTAQVESFADPLLRLWLTRFPHVVEAKSIPLAEILPAADLVDVKARATAAAVDSTIPDKLKAKPSIWFSYLRNNLGNGTRVADVARFAERKAARDALEHHDGVVDPSYAEKAKGAFIYNVGDLIEPTDADLDALYDMVCSLINEIASDAIRHFPATAAATP